MGFLLRIFTGNPLAMVWVALGIAAVSGAAGTAAGWTLNGWRLGTELEHARSELATCTGSLARTEDANKAFAGAVAAQTSSIRSLEAATLERDRRATEASEAAAKQGKKIENQGAAILKRPLPSTVAGDCPALEVDLDEVVRERKGRAP